MFQSLDGKTILVTRPRQGVDSLSALLNVRGAKVLYQPSIELLPLVDTTLFCSYYDRLSSFDWLVFSSANGVHFFFDLLETLHLSFEKKTIQVAAMGPGTASALEERTVAVDLIPNDYRAEGMVEALADAIARKERILSIRGSRGRTTLPDGIRQCGGTVEECIVYESKDIKVASPEVLVAFQQGTIDMVTLTGSAIARSTVSLFGELLRQTGLVSISPLTSQVMTELGFPVQAEAIQPTMDALVQACCTFRKN